MTKEELGKSQYSWINYIHDRVLNRSKNFVCSITGPTGSGKTYFSLSMAEHLDKDFNADRIIFRADDLMELINSGTLKSGSVIVWDEAGIDLSNRNWQSQLNKVINYLLQTFRHRNFILIFTMPYADFVDSASRKLFHAELETVSINRQKKICSVKPKMLQYNASMKKWYRKYLKVIKKDRGVVKVKRWGMPLPSKELIGAYEKKKTNFTSELNREIQQTLQRLQQNKERKGPTEKQKEIIDCWKSGITKQKEMAEKLGVSEASISERIRYLRFKGINAEDYKENKDIRENKP